MLRLLLLALMFLISLLTVFAAPTWHLWLLSIVVTEHSWVFLLVTIILLLFHRKPARARLWEFPIGSAAILLFALPIVQAIHISRNLEEKLQLAFGEAVVTEEPAGAPFSLVRLGGGMYFKDEPFETVVYDSAAGLSLDFYRSRQNGRRPCAVVVHGGSWKSGDSRQLPELNTILARNGFHVAAVNYRKAPEHKFPSAISDVKSSLAFLKRQAEPYQIDTNAFYLIGRSAGAQIALLVAYDSATSINGVVSFYGPADMVWGWTLPANPLVMDSRKVMSDYLGGPFEKVPEQYAASSATLMVRSKAPPTLMIHGGNDPLVAYEHNLRLIKRLHQNRVKYYLLTLPWATHGFDYFSHGPGGQLATYSILYFLSATNSSSNQKPMISL